jgi:hypothetical protein
MMLFRLSQKLAKKLKVTGLKSLPPDNNAFADWSSHLFTVDRQQYIIVSNTASLYSVLLLGRGISNEKRFVAGVLGAIREVLIADGQGPVYERWIAPAADAIAFGTALNRSVIGSMNDLVKCLRWSAQRAPISPIENSLALNDTPMSMLGMDKPGFAFKAMVAKARELQRVGDAPSRSNGRPSVGPAETHR